MSQAQANGGGGLSGWVARLPAILALAGVIGSWYVLQDRSRVNGERIDRLEAFMREHAIQAARRDAEIQGTQDILRGQVDGLKSFERGVAEVQRKLDRLCAALRPKCRED